MKTNPYEKVVLDPLGSVIQTMGGVFDPLTPQSAWGESPYKVGRSSGLLSKLLIFKNQWLESKNKFYLSVRTCDLEPNFG
ncbi:MAG: hypothetical protein HY717_23105 [Planctomycetes bacterium]|nr:hypothetical protein [Planctomycetota bacterium]